MLDQELIVINNAGEIERRKSDHIRIVREEDVEYACGTLFDDVHLVHNALPELDFDSIDSSCEFFGKPLSAPLMILSITGGTRETYDLNR